MHVSINVLTIDPNFRHHIQVVPIGVRPPRLANASSEPGSTLDRSILLDPPAAALVPPKFEFSKLENGAVGINTNRVNRGSGWLGVWGWGRGGRKMGMKAHPERLVYKFLCFRDGRCSKHGLL